MWVNVSFYLLWVGYSPEHCREENGVPGSGITSKIRGRQSPMNLAIEKAVCPKSGPHARINV